MMAAKTPINRNNLGIQARTEFAKKAGISSASLAKLGKGANVTTDILVKICEELKCDISDICEIVADEAVEEKD